MTFEEIVNAPKLKDGTEVSIRLLDKTFNGKIVGISSDGVIPNYIIECTDGTFPSETYNYKFLALPLSEISIK